MKKHRKTVLAAIMLILVVASAVFAARVHTVSLDAENVAKITAKSTVTKRRRMKSCSPTASAASLRRISAA